VSVFIGKNPWMSQSFPRARTVLNEIAKDPGRSMIVIDPVITDTAKMADPPRTLSRNLQLRDIQTLSCSTWSATPSPDPPGRPGEGENMSVYRVTEVIGTSTESWEHAARSAVETAAATVREIRVAEVTRQDVTIENGQVAGYRVRLAISFKYESDR
jgi:flavin-binding protein dodecin